MSGHRVERHIGIIGYGAIGRALADALLSDDSHSYAISVLVRASSPRPAKSAAGMAWVHDFARLAKPPAVVVEAAGHGAVASMVPRLLQSGISVIVASVGALADDALRTRLEQCAKDGGARLILPSGAIGGLDYLRAAAMVGPLDVRYTSRKPPSAWRDELAASGLAESDIGDELVLFFEGSARDAATHFPQNLNVAATLAVAGIGMDQTCVRVVVDPKVSTNSHQIEIEGPLGQASFTFVNTPSPQNPKTSRITAMSLHGAVRRFFGD